MAAGTEIASNRSRGKAAGGHAIEGGTSIMHRDGGGEGRGRKEEGKFGQRKGESKSKIHCAYDCQ